MTTPKTSANKPEDLKTVSPSRRQDRFNALVLPCYPMVLSAAHRDRATSGEADDITQETMIKADKAFEAFQGTNVLAWLKKILKNTQVDHIRAATRKPKVSLDQLSLGRENRLPDRGCDLGVASSYIAQQNREEERSAADNLLVRHCNIEQSRRDAHATSNLIFDGVRRFGSPEQNRDFKAVYDRVPPPKKKGQKIREALPLAEEFHDAEADEAYFDKLPAINRNAERARLRGVAGMLILVPEQPSQENLDALFSIEAAEHLRPSAGLDVALKKILDTLNDRNALLPGVRMIWERARTRLFSLAKQLRSADRADNYILAVTLDILEYAAQIGGDALRQQFLSAMDNASRAGLLENAFVLARLRKIGVWCGNAGFLHKAKGSETEGVIELADIMHRTYPGRFPDPRWFEQMVRGGIPDTLAGIRKHLPRTLARVYQHGSSIICSKQYHRPATLHWVISWLNRANEESKSLAINASKQASKVFHGLQRYKSSFGAEPSLAFAHQEAVARFGQLAA